VAEAGCGSLSRSQSSSQLYIWRGLPLPSVLEVGDQLLALSLPQHPDENGPQRPVLLAVDQ
jgi:hypothetical protein